MPPRARVPKKAAEGGETPAPPLPPSEPPLPSAPPYTSSAEHLNDELSRADRFVKAQTLRWRTSIGQSKPENYWGMVHVTEAEVSAFVNAAYSASETLPPEVNEAIAGHIAAASELAATIDSRLASTPASTPLRLRSLVEMFSLSALEKDIVLLILLPEVDGRYRRLYGYLQDDASRSQPNMELVLQILRPLVPAVEGRAAFRPEGPLQADQLLAVPRQPVPEDPLPVRGIRLDDRIVSFLLSSDAIDSRLRPILSIAAPLAPERLAGKLLSPEYVAGFAAWYRNSNQGASIFLHGPYGSGRLAAARALATTLELPLLLCDADAATRLPAGWESAVDLAYREARLRGAALFWSCCETLFSPDQPAHRWRFLAGAAEKFAGLSFFAGSTAPDTVGHFRTQPFLRFEFPVPGYESRRDAWLARLAEIPNFAGASQDLDTLADLLGNAFQLTYGQIGDVVVLAQALATQRSPADPKVTADDLYEGCRRQSGRRLSSFARRIEPHTVLTFDDLIIPEANRRQLSELRLRIRNRNRVYAGLGFERRFSLGKGLIALFTGSSGTGKTMAAELLAREQGTDLYKIDLSAVVSKYVGETEKNLSRVFAEAEDSNAIIFFDEADALFGKRGEVKEAHDRWANMETNFLLQRVEEYAGVVILASNLRQNIDEAFTRRIHVIVEFPFPDAPARARILQGLFPAGLGYPSPEDLRRVIDRFKLPGGSLKNIVIDAAFRALAESSEGTPVITLRHLVSATAREYQKLGKTITKGEFGVEFYQWVMEDILLNPG